MKNNDNLFPRQSTPVTRGDLATMARLSSDAGSVQASDIFADCRRACGGARSGACYDSCVQKSFSGYGCGPLGC